MADRLKDILEENEIQMQLEGAERERLVDYHGREAGLDGTHAPHNVYSKQYLPCEDTLRPSRWFSRFQFTHKTHQRYRIAS